MNKVWIVDNKIRQERTGYKTFFQALDAIADTAEGPFAGFEVEAQPSTMRGDGNFFWLRNHGNLVGELECVTVSEGNPA